MIPSHWSANLRLYFYQLVASAVWVGFDILMSMGDEVKFFSSSR